jgi:aminomethyltransferase
MWRQDPYLERYEVPGGGSIIIELLPDDVLVIIDPEGKQVGELAAFSPKGKPDTSALSTGAVTPATNLQSILNGPEESARQVSAGLKRRGIDIGSAEAVALFDHDTPSGEQTTFTADRQVTCILSAPGGKMIVDEQTPPTPLLAWIHRSQKRLLSSPALPEPLADPKQDFLVKACTASSFTVKVGEFIQIIDVSGRECSDFLAFSKAQLDNGLERGLDLTTTRTLTGTGYPGPGLFSKFFDQDMQPLLEVVRDTCGRHDTFGLACASKYYEEQGYFGHPNCSDNLSKAIEGYGIRARRGWPAINFFYNTNIDEQNVLYGDEPWSRPGDYVLLKALTDLVCASSACPDDISAANGWNPTDIHVRVYAPSNVFSKAVAYRMTPNDETRLTKETGFHPRTSALTRNIAEYRGYWLPTSYNNRGAIDEYWACREKAVMIDLSPLRKFEVLGPDAEVLLQHVLTRNVRRLAVGQVVYSAMCYPHGGMLDDGTLLRLGPDNFRWIGGDDYGGLWMREEAKRLGYRVWIKSSTNQLHNIAVQGPASRDILKDIVWTPPSQTRIDELEWFRFTIGRVRDLNGIPIMISRTGYTGELGFEIFCHPKDAVTVWDAVWKAGQSRGVSPMGLDALDMVRIESGLVFSGYEFSDQTDPFESGIGFTVPLKTKEDHFVGREALVERKNKPQRKLVGLEMEGNEPGAHGDCVHVEHGRAQVGVVTSATRSPILRKNIALARLDVTHAETGTYVEIGKLDGHQKRIPAVVVPLPFYDPKKERVRA